MGSDYPKGFTPEVVQRLLAPFPPDEIDFLAKNVRNGRALALAYIDARAVMRRLDEAVGPGNWSFDYEVQDAPDCRRVKGMLTVLGVLRCDAGEADKEGEPLKSAVSDALKRAAVHFGVGRFLYLLPTVWGEYDEQKRTWKSQPQIKPKDLEEICRIIGYKGSVPDAQRVTRQQVEESFGAPPPPDESPPLDNEEPASKPVGGNCCKCWRSMTPGQVSFTEKKWGERLCGLHQPQAGKGG